MHSIRRTWIVQFPFYIAPTSWSNKITVKSFAKTSYGMTNDAIRLFLSRIILFRSQSRVEDDTRLRDVSLFYLNPHDDFLNRAVCLSQLKSVKELWESCCVSLSVVYSVGTENRQNTAGCSRLNQLTLLATLVLGCRTPRDFISRFELLRVALQSSFADCVRQSISIRAQLLRRLRAQRRRFGVCNFADALQMGEHVWIRKASQGGGGEGDRY